MTPYIGVFGHPISERSLVLVIGRASVGLFIQDNSDILFPSFAHCQFIGWAFFRLLIKEYWDILLTSLTPCQLLEGLLFDSLYRSIQISCLRV